MEPEVGRPDEEQKVLAGLAPDAKQGIFGRDPELATVSGFLSPDAGGPAALLITGEAGIGKTRLWQEAMEQAAGRGVTVLAARPAESETTLTFAGLRDLTEPYVSELGNLPTPQRRALEVAFLLSEATGATPNAHAVGAAFLNVLRSLSRNEKVLVGIDDVQWLDRASAAALEFAMRRLSSEQVRLLLTFRRSAEAAPPGWLDRALSAGVRQITLNPLSLGAIHRMIVTRTGTVLPRPTLHKIYEASGGNPFFALELAQAIGRGAIQVVSGVPLDVPPSLRQLVMLRLVALSSEAVEALRIVAALSQPTLAVLQSISERHARALETAVDAQVVEISGDRIRFSHPLLASAAYATGDVRSRRALHEQLARVVADPEERARHLALAATGTDARVASELDMAAKRAHARGAGLVAAELAERARLLTPQGERDADFRRLTTEAWYRFEGGDALRARELLDAGIAKSPPSTARAAALALLARIHLYEGDQALAADIFLQAVEEAGPDFGVRSDAEMGLSTALFFQRIELPRAARHGARAVRLAREIGDRRALAAALAQQAMNEGVLGRPTAVNRIKEALLLEPQTEQRQIVQSPSFCYGTFLLWTDRFDEARSQFLACQQQAVERGDESSLPLARAQLSVIECLTGDWLAAARFAEAGQEAALQTGQRPQQSYALAALALVHTYRGEEQAARNAASAALACLGNHGGMVARMAALSALGLLELSLGRPGETHRILGPLADAVEAEHVGEPGSIRFMTDDVEALIALGRHPEAERRLDRFESHAKSVDRASALAACARSRGLLAAAQGDLRAACAAFQRSLREGERVQMPFERARTLLLLGSARRRAKEKKGARGTLEEALALFQRLGSGIWAEQAVLEIRRISGRISAGIELTASERRVAALVSEGRSNKEVARALFLAERTVEAHLSHIFAKMGVRSRTELARAHQVLNQHS